MQLFLKVSKSTLRILPVKNVEIGRIYVLNRSYKNWQPCVIIYISHRHFTRFPRIFETRRDKAFACCMPHQNRHLLHRRIAFGSRIFASHVSSVPIVLTQWFRWICIRKKKGERERKRVSEESST